MKERIDKSILAGVVVFMIVLFATVILGGGGQSELDLGSLALTLGCVFGTLAFGAAFFLIAPKGQA